DGSRWPRKVAQMHASKGARRRVPLTTPERSSNSHRLLNEKGEISRDLAGGLGDLVAPEKEGQHTVSDAHGLDFGVLRQPLWFVNCNIRHLSSVPQRAK